MISSLNLQNFRSYGNSAFEFEKGVNIIVGPNASGKTNLLEAVLVLCRGTSYRVKDSELIKFKRSWAKLDGFFGNQERILKLKAKPTGLEKKYQIDGTELRRLSFERKLPLVLFEPNHLQLITRGPDQRRDYFDDLLERSQLEYKTIIANYKRALSQRNTLLKKPRNIAQKQLFVWNVRLSELGAKIVAARQALAEDINKELSHTYSQIAGVKTKALLEYSCQLDIASYGSKLLSKLENNIDTDLERGFTGYGPHRDDFNSIINGQQASTTASRGESRSFMLALKIYEMEMLSNARSVKPILLLDDVFSELDGARRHSLVDYLKNNQVIITTTDADTVVGYFASGEHNLITLK